MSPFGLMLYSLHSMVWLRIDKAIDSELDVFEMFTNGRIVKDLRIKN